VGPQGTRGDHAAAFAAAHSSQTDGWSAVDGAGCVKSG